MNQTLGKTAREEIRKAMTGLVGTAAATEAKRLSGIHLTTVSHIYRMTKDLRQTERKTRSDAGKRTYELVEGTDVWFAAQFVIVDKLDPDQALLTAKLRRPDAKLPTLETFQKLLRENGCGKKARRTGRRAHRRWEAEFPGQIFQIDVTALKARWQDVTTRRIHRIEGIDKNHPAAGEGKQRVWQIMLVDDHSRRRFLRYVTTTAITSMDMVRFECEAFSKLGVPHVLYTDNGSEFKGQHLIAERILNSLLTDEGGYKHERHAPGNPQATGKVEGAHKWAEKMDRLIGLAVTEGQRLDIDDLNRFADEIVEHYDHRIHRATGEKPINRWHGKRVVVRKVSPDVVESALLSDYFPAVINADLTVTHRKVSYRLSNERIFVDAIGQTVQVVIPPHIDMILITMPNGAVFEGPKMIAGVDAAGEYKTMADGRREQITKQMKASRKEEISAIKEQKKLTGQIAPVPHLNVPIELPQSDIINFPQREMVMSADEVNAIVPVVMPDVAAETDTAVADRSSSVAYVGKPIGFWQSVSEYGDRFESKDDAKQFLRAIFADDSVTVPVTQVEAAIEARDRKPEGIRLAG